MAEQTPVFPDLSLNTHMPFFDRRTLLFCGAEQPVERESATGGTVRARARHDRGLASHFGSLPATTRVTYRRWKLYYCTWDDRRPRRVYTGLGADVIECSPAFYADGNVLHVSFIGGVPGDRGPVYHLYGMRGASFDALTPAAPLIPNATSVGCAGPDFVCWAAPGGLTVLERGADAPRRLAVPMARVRRVAFRADNPQELLITGADAGGAPRTLVYDLRSGKTQEVLADVPVYKSSIAGSQLIVAHPSGGGPEPYRLVTSTYTLADAPQAIVPK